MVDVDIPSRGICQNTLQYYVTMIIIIKERDLITNAQAYDPNIYDKVTSVRKLNLKIIRDWKLSPLDVLRAAVLLSKFYNDIRDKTKSTSYIISSILKTFWQLKLVTPETCLKLLCNSQKYYSLQLNIDQVLTSRSQYNNSPQYFSNFKQNISITTVHNSVLI